MNRAERFVESLRQNIQVSHAPAVVAATVQSAQETACTLELTASGVAMESVHYGVTEVGTANDQVARGDHHHDNLYLPKRAVDVSLETSAFEKHVNRIYPIAIEYDGYSGSSAGFSVEVFETGVNVQRLVFHVGHLKTELPYCKIDLSIGSGGMPVSSIGVECSKDAASVDPCKVYLIMSKRIDAGDRTRYGIRASQLYGWEGMRLATAHEIDGTEAPHDQGVVFSNLSFLYINLKNSLPPYQGDQWRAYVQDFATVIDNPLMYIEFFMAQKPSGREMMRRDIQKIDGKYFYIFPIDRQIKK